MAVKLALISLEEVEDDDALERFLVALGYPPEAAQEHVTPGHGPGAPQMVHGRGGSMSSVIGRVESQIRNLDHERAAFVGAGGGGQARVLWAADGTIDQVPVPREVISRLMGKNVVLVHNHPAMPTNAPRGRSLSTDDAILSHMIGASEMRAVNRSGRTYSVKPPKGKKTLGDIDMPNLIKEYNSAVRKDFEPRVWRGEWTADKAGDLHHNEMWSRAAKDGRIRYEVVDA